MKKSVFRLAFGLLVGGIVAFALVHDQQHPLERATVTELKVGYYSSGNGWVFSSEIPTSERELQVCGLMEKSEPSELLFTVTAPNDRNDFLRLDEFYFDIRPGDFCVKLHLLRNAPPGEYTLWVMDARHGVGQASLSFVEE